MKFFKSCSIASQRTGLGLANLLIHKAIGLVWSLCLLFIANDKRYILYDINKMVNDSKTLKRKSNATIKKVQDINHLRQECVSPSSSI